MVVRGPLNDSERAARDAHVPLTDDERDASLQGKIDAIEEWAAGMLLLLQKQDATRRRQREKDGYVRDKRGATKAIGGLPSTAHVKVDLVEMLSELQRLGSHPAEHLAALRDYISNRTGGRGDKCANLHAYRGESFHAAVRYCAENRGIRLSNRKIAKAAGVDDKTIGEWRKLPDWECEIDDAQAILAFRAESAE
jgi:hypothetical protein